MRRGVAGARVGGGWRGRGGRRPQLSRSLRRRQRDMAGDAGHGRGELESSRKDTFLGKNDKKYQGLDNEDGAQTYHLCFT